MKKKDLLNTFGSRTGTYGDCMWKLWRKYRWEHTGSDNKL